MALRSTAASFRRGEKAGKDSIVYVSSGASIYRYPEVQQWIERCPFRLVNSSRLLRSMGQPVGREELGIVEALICCEAASFAGAKWSTHSHCVRLVREERVEGKKWTTPRMSKRRFVDQYRYSASTFLWDVECKGALVRPGPESQLSLESRQNAEYDFLKTHG